MDQNAQVDPGDSGANGCQACRDLDNAANLPLEHSCGRLAHRLIVRLKQTIADGIATETRLRNEIDENAAAALEQRRALETIIAELEQRLGRTRVTERDWRQMVRDHLQQPQRGVTWDMIWKQCCKEENMSSQPHVTHPNIRLQGPDITGDPAFEVEEPTPVPEVPFPFEQLPWQIQVNIFRLWLHKEGQLIHPLSRLDQYVELTAFPDEDQLQGRSGLPRGFYWGKTHYNVTDDRRDPNQVLRILLVSKRFFFIGVHCFYGLNTFAFSSLGEFDRFCNGIGGQRIERLQHLELTWQGNQYLSFPPAKDVRGNDTKNVPLSRRTGGLYAFQSCYRLRTLVIHINETGKSYIRRKYEAASIKRFMTRKTQGQPNQRMTRCLRAVGGLDCIHQLRGLHWIRFYDLHKAVGDSDKAYTGERVDITDWSFAEDLTNVTTMEKVPSRRENSQLKNLDPLFPITGHIDDSDDEEDPAEWVPTVDDWKIVHCYYIGDNGRGSYDDIRRLGHHQDMDLPSHLSTTDSNSSASFLADSSDSDSGDSSEDGDSRPAPRRPGPRPTRGAFYGRGRGLFRGRRPAGRATNARGREGPTLEQLIADVQNRDDTDSDLESDTPTPSEEDRQETMSISSDSDDSDAEPEVVEIDDSSESEDSLFVRQRTGSSAPRNPTSNAAPDTTPDRVTSDIPAPQPVREDIVIPLPFTAALQQSWGFTNMQPPRQTTSTTPGGRTRFRSSTSSGLFVTPRTSPMGVTPDLVNEANQEDDANEDVTILSVRRSPSVKSEPGRAFISANLAGRVFDLTLEEENNEPALENDQPSLPVIMEVDEHEHEHEHEAENEGTPTPVSPTGSKRGSQSGEEDPETGEERDAKRPRI